VTSLQLAEPPAPKRRYVFLDALRGFAALAVVLFHAQAGGHIDALVRVLPGAVRRVIEHGDLGVQVFFVLSGFVIAHSMSRDRITLRYVGGFMLRRSIRLDPPYWASMALVVGFGVLAAHVLPDRAYELPSWRTLTIHALYLQVLLQVPSLDSVYWTLCLEIQFYLVFALLLWVVQRLATQVADRTAFYLVFIPAALFANLWAARLGPFHVVGLFTGHWYFFLAGVFVWNAVAHPGDRLSTPVAIANLLVLGAPMVAYGSVELGVTIATCAAILVVARQDGLYTWLGQRPLLALGTISYSLYLVHNPISGAAFRVGYKLTGRSLATEALWFVLVPCICIACAWVFHRMFELPSLRFANRMRVRRQGSAQPSTNAAPTLATNTERTHGGE